MDISFALHALAVEWLAREGAGLKAGVQPAPPDLDREIARLKLAALGVAIDHGDARAGRIPQHLVRLKSPRVWRPVFVPGDMRALSLALLAAVLIAAPAQAELSGPSVPPPAGCTPVTIAFVHSVDGPVCVHRVLVTDTTNASEQNRTDFTVTDHESRLEATFANWWPQGPPQAGMVVTLWGHFDPAGHPGKLVIDRWIDLAHGTGPAPTGPIRWSASWMCRRARCPTTAPSGSRP